MWTLTVCLADTDEGAQLGEGGEGGAAAAVDGRSLQVGRSSDGRARDEGGRAIRPPHPTATTPPLGPAAGDAAVRCGGEAARTAATEAAPAASPAPIPVHSAPSACLVVVATGPGVAPLESCAWRTPSGGDCNDERACGGGGGSARRDGCALRGSEDGWSGWLTICCRGAGVCSPTAATAASDHGGGTASPCAVGASAAALLPLLWATLPA